MWRRLTVLVVVGSLYNSMICKGKPRHDAKMRVMSLGCQGGLEPCFFLRYPLVEVGHLKEWGRERALLGRAK